MFSRLFLTVFLGCAVLSPVHAQNGSATPRIPRRVDDSSVVTLRQTTHPLLKSARDGGRVGANLRLDRLTLLLKSSPEQEAALEQLLIDQQDPGSARYRQWLTPQQFGEQYGVSQQDLDTISAWLRGHGFQVDGVANGRRSIEFSGTVRQVESAFHTEIRNYEVNGEPHIANATDISIPEALGQVVGGVLSLHDFHSKALHQAKSLNPSPEYNSGGNHAISPYDFAIIYNVLPLWNQGIDGTGQSIAVIGRSNINMSDVTTFRSTFGLPGNNTQIILNGPDPGIPDANEQFEANLDVQWTGAVAKGAAIKFVISKSTRTADGVDLSAQYAVNNNVAPVVTVSFGACEGQLGSDNQAYNSLWQQAAAQGISVFVATGDTGSAGCDDPTTTRAVGGFGVNGLATTPYNVAVGGTQFNDVASPSTYWNSTPGPHQESAKGYIPESVWNQSSPASNLYAAGGGVSTLYPTPSWQTGVGVPAADPSDANQHHRYIPDVSLSAAISEGYLVQQNGAVLQVGGTSASTPTFAGIMALINQRSGSANGNPNPLLYSLAAQVPAAFHDITLGTNAVPCSGGSPGCSAPAPSSNVGNMTGYNAGPGFDLATGLGSVDASLLAASWSGAPAPVTITSLSPNPMAGSNSNQTLTVTGSGFQSGATLQIQSGSTPVSASITSLTNSQIQALVNVGTTPRTLSVQVLNPNARTSNSVSLQVSAPTSAPVISSLSPNSVAGSNFMAFIQVIGTGFQPGVQLVLSYPGFSTSLPSGQVFLLSNTAIGALVSLGTTTRTWGVQAINPDGSASNVVFLPVNGATPPPAITSLNPNPMTGSASNQTLTIAGSGFQAGNALKVQVGTTLFQGPQIPSVTATQIQVSVNVGTAARTLNVQVTNPDNQQSSAVSLQVNGVAAPAPSVTSVSPNPIAGSAANQVLTITGNNFQSGAAAKLVLGSAVIQGAITSLSATQIQVSVIVGIAANTLNVQVANPDGQVSNVLPVPVKAPAPAVTSVSPNPITGSASSQTLTITGSNFQGGSGLQVLVGSSTLQGPAILSATTTQIQVSANVGVIANTVSVIVTNPDGQSSNAVSLQVKAPPPPPAITSLNPNPITGSASSQTLTINGSNFQSGAGLQVQVGSTILQSPQLTSVTAGQITLPVTVGTAGTTLNVKVTNPDGQSSNAVSLQVQAPPPPAITSVSPNPITGSNSNQTLTITGSSFQPGNGLQVIVGPATLQGASILSATSSQIQVAANVGIAANTISVKVVNPDGQSSGTLSLQVKAPPPAITSLGPNPMTGSASSQTLTINGSNFQSGAGLQVQVGSNILQSAQITSVSASQIQVSVTVGIAATTLSVKVTNPDGQSSNAVSLQVQAPAPPAITSLSPNPMKGSNSNQTLTVTGSGFQSGAALQIQSGSTTIPATVTSVTSSQIQAQVNVGTVPGTLSVQVVNPDGGTSNSVSLQVSASSSTAPVITSLTPNTTAPSAFMAFIQINGTGFQQGLQVVLSYPGFSTTLPSGQVFLLNNMAVGALVSLGTTARTWGVQVINPDGQVSNTIPFTVH